MDLERSWVSCCRICLRGRGLCNTRVTKSLIYSVCPVCVKERRGLKEELKKQVFRRKERVGFREEMFGRAVGRKVDFCEYILSKFAEAKAKAWEGHCQRRESIDWIVKAKAKACEVALGGVLGV
jgi:hypothetical protein